MSEIDGDYFYQKGYTKGCIDGGKKYLDFIVKQERLRTPDPIILKCSEFEKCPLKEEKQQRRWIPVSERLPENQPGWIVGTTYIITKKNKRVELVKYKESKWIGNFGRIVSDEEVLAWQPLPEPYKEASHE